MGKSIKNKQKKLQADEAEFRDRMSALIRVARTPAPIDPLVVHFQPYSEHFLRDPGEFAFKGKSRDRDRHILQMARHLFGRYRAPSVLERAWLDYLPDPARRAPYARAGQDLPARLDNPNLKRFDFRAWYVCVATGGSLYKQHTRAWFTKRETHEFLGAPQNLDPCQALVRAVALAAGADSGSAQRLARSHLATRPLEGFWLDAIRFLARPENHASIQQVNDLADYLHARRQETPDFSLMGSGATMPALLRRMEQWHRALARARDLSGAVWEGNGMPDHEIELVSPHDRNIKIKWRFHQITTGKELAAEGTAQRHCVFSYKHSCISGKCSVWSLTSQVGHASPKRALTIELSNSGAIVQKRRLANQMPKPEEENAVRLWAREFGLLNGRG